MDQNCTFRYHTPKYKSIKLHNCNHYYPAFSFFNLASRDVIEKIGSPTHASENKDKTILINTWLFPAQESNILQVIKVIGSSKRCNKMADSYNHELKDILAREISLNIYRVEKGPFDIRQGK
jgi:hypothetical protein